MKRICESFFLIFSVFYCSVQGAEWNGELSKEEQFFLQSSLKNHFFPKEFCPLISQKLSKDFLEINMVTFCEHPGNIEGLLLAFSNQQPIFQEELFYFNLQEGDFYIRFLKAFISDTFDFIEATKDSFLCSGNNIDSGNTEIVKIGLDGKILNVTNLGKGDFRIYLHEDDVFLGHCKKEKFTLSYLNQEIGQFQLIWRSLFLLSSIRCPVIDGKMYIISPMDDKKYTIQTLKKTNDSYSLIPTNVITEKVIARFIPDSKNFAHILAFQTAYFSQYQWHYLDDDFKKKIDGLSEKISESLNSYYPYAWQFDDIPYFYEVCGSENSSVFLNKTGSISFNDYTIAHDKIISCDCNGLVAIEELKNLTLVPFPQPKKVTIEDSEEYPIDYALFESSHDDAPMPTVMIIEGGPRVFIEHKSYAKAIRFFKENGYHVVIPQGLFRVGYNFSHVLKGKGEFGGLDMEHLRCVLQDLKNKSISSSIFVMGASYGGYSAARLSADSHLVNAAFVENALLDCTYRVFEELDGYFFSKGSEDLDVIDQRKRERSPALESALPKVPVFVKSVQTDVCCPMDQSQRFVQRLMKNNLPVVYLEAHSGGHEESFSDFQIIKDFFEGNYGMHNVSSVEDKYDLKSDTVGFFRK